MEILVVVVVAVVGGFIANKYMNRRSMANGENNEQVLNDETVDNQAGSYEPANEEQNSEKNNVEDKVMEEKKGTRDLFLQTLTAIGCQYEIDEGEDGDIHFGYQGEYFVVRTSNSVRFVQIYDTHWGHIELYDIDEFARLKKAINESNIRNSVTTVYTIDEAGSIVNVHCKSVILFIQEIPNLADYLRLELSEYFRVHETINMEMAKQREAEVGRE